MTEKTRLVKQLRPRPFRSHGLSSVTLESIRDIDVIDPPGGFYHPCEDAIMKHPDDTWQGDVVLDLWLETDKELEHREYLVRCECCERIHDVDDICACGLEPAFDDVNHDQVDDANADDIPLGRMGWYEEFGNPSNPRPPRKRVVVESKPTTAAHIIGAHQECDFCLIAGAFARITSIGMMPSNEVESRDTLVTNTLSWDDFRIFPCHSGYNFTSKSFKWFGRKIQTVGIGMPRVSHLPAAESITVEALAERARVYLGNRGYEDELIEFVRVPNASAFIMDEKNSSPDLMRGPTVQHRVPLYAISKYSAFAVASPSANAKRRVRDFYSQTRDPIGGNSAVASDRAKNLCGCGHCWEKMLMKDQGLIRLAMRTGLPIPYVRVNPKYYEDLLEEILDAHAQERLTVIILEGDVF